MTRDVVLKQVDEVGYVNINFYFIGETYCEVYSFNIGAFTTPRGGRWSVCYDPENKVIKIEEVLSR